MGLGARLAAVRRRLRPARLEVDLDVVEQLVIGQLLHVDSVLAQDLRDHVLLQRRTANPQQVRLSLVRLASLRLIAEVDADAATSPNGRRYRLTRDGKRLRVVIPAQPRSSIRTHL